MAQRSYFFDSVAGDRIYNASDMSRVLARLVGRDGVVYGYEGELKVSPTSPEGMSVAVAIGAAFVQGRLFEVYDLPETLAIAPADPVNPRIDRVVVRLDNSSAVRSVTLAVKAGTPAASPTPPTLQRDGTVWELSLAQVRVNAGVTSITAANITGERSDEAVCGFVPRTPDIVHRGTQKDMSSLSAFLDLLWAPPAARVYHNAAQSIPNATNTILQFNSERFDTEGIHDTTTNTSRLICKTAGKYYIAGSVRFALNSTGFRELNIILNGSSIIARVSLPAANGSPTVLQISTVYNLAVNNYVELQIYQNSGGALDVEYASAYSPEFMMVRVG